jgi:hypothetical protein
MDVSKLTDEMVEWYQIVGGTVIHKTEYLGRNGTETQRVYVAYNSKPCHYMQDSTNNVRLHFSGKDASAASMFLIRFFENVIQHNLKEVTELNT